MPCFIIKTTYKLKYTHGATIKSINIITVKW